MAPVRMVRERKQDAGLAVPAPAEVQAASVPPDLRTGRRGMPSR